MNNPKHQCYPVFVCRAKKIDECKKKIKLPFSVPIKKKTTVFYRVILLSIIIYYHNIDIIFFVTNNYAYFVSLIINI